MVVLIALFQSSQYGDGRSLVGFVDHHFLEAAFERLILLEVFLILVKGGGADRAELAAGESRLENIGGIHGAFPFSGTYEGMDFINEEDNLAVALSHLVDNGFQALLELPFIFGSGHQSAHVERENLLAAEVFGHITTHYTLRESLGYGRLAGARFADKHRVVFGAPRKNLEHTANLVVTSDYRVELA